MDLVSECISCVSVRAWHVSVHACHAVQCVINSIQFLEHITNELFLHQNGAFWSAFMQIAFMQVFKQQNLVFNEIKGT